MRYKRKPMVRDVVDALKGGDSYTVQRENGKLDLVSIEEFERDYEKMKRNPYAKKPHRVREPKAKKNDNTA